MSEICIWSIVGMMLTEKNLNTWRKTCSSTTICTANPMWTVLEKKLSLQ